MLNAYRITSPFGGIAYMWATSYERVEKVMMLHGYEDVLIQKEMTHDEKVQAAKDAVNQVFCDTSVPPQQTLDSLEEIKEDVEDVINAVEDYLRNLRNVEV